MPHARYFIVRHDDRWIIKFLDEEFGPYQSEKEAMLFAVDAAQKLGEQGENAQVCVMGENGHFRPEWTFGQDSYPPRL
jgi:20S proteasome alpha/beta subunit